MSDKTTPGAGAVTWPKGASPSYAPSCPICKKPTEPRLRPFCSRRCADVDLARWLSGTYAISGGSDDHDEDGDGPAASSPRRSAEEPE